MGHGAREVEVARGGVRRLHLAEDLRLADDERVETGRHAEEMARRVDAAMAVDVLGQAGGVEAVVVAEKARDGVGGRVRVGDGVDLGPVTGRQDHRLGADPARGERVERPRRGPPVRSRRLRATPRAPCGG